MNGEAECIACTQARFLVACLPISRRYGLKLYKCSSCGSSLLLVSRITLSKRQTIRPSRSRRLHSMDEMVIAARESSLSRCGTVVPFESEGRATKQLREIRQWTSQEEKQFRELLRQDRTAVEIASALGRTRGAIYSRIQRFYRQQTRKKN
jgi:hypothetical protein